MRAAWIVIVALLIGAPLDAQRLTQTRTAAHRLAVVSSESRTRVTQPDTADHVILRLLSAAAFEVVGFLAGAYIGSNLEGDCQCDDPGLEGGLVGGSIGMVIGAGIGAALPNGGSCGFGTRLLHGIGGAFVGWGVGVAIGLVSGGPGLLVLPVSVPLGAIMIAPRCPAPG